MKGFPGIPIAAAVLAALAGLVPVSAAAAGDAPAVVVTRKPLHALVAGVMQGVGEPVLLFDGAAAAGPLDAGQKAALGKARLLFWLGKDQAPTVAATIAKRGGDLTTVSLLRVPGVRLMDARAGHRLIATPTARPPVHAAPVRKAAPQIKDGNVIFRKRGDPSPKAATKSAHKSAPRAAVRRPQARAVPTPIRTPDPHIWLDPRNAIAVVRATAEVLAKADPANATRYRRNAAVLVVRIEALDDGMTATVRALGRARYAVTNNGLQYFEDNYVMRPALELRLTSPAPAKGALAAAHRQIAASGLTCVLAPTALDAKSGAALVAGTKARLVRLDVDGTVVKPGSDAYFAIIRGIGGKITACLR